MSESASLSTPNRGRLRWQCRRGMRELDVLLEGYLTRHFEQAPPALQEAFADLLQREDPDIWAWLIGHAQPPPELADVIVRLQHQP